MTTSKLLSDTPAPLRCRPHPWRVAGLVAGLALASSAWAQATTAPVGLAANPEGAQAAGAPLLTLKDKMSYSTGVMTARTLTKNDVPFDLELLIQGLRDGLAGGPIRISEKELKVVLQSMQADITRKMTNERQVKGSLAREKGTIFQNEYKNKPGVTVLPGNLMYHVTKQGQGDKPAELGTVVVRYKGRLVDGTEFDATPEGKTATIKLGDTISGWREVLRHVPAGSTLEMVVPPNFAYGTRGAPNAGIGPNETLVFQVELVAVVQ